MGAPEEEEQRPPSDITVYGANCTLHGLSHIFLPGGVTIRRLLWAAAFSSSLSCFLYQVAGMIILYYQYPHVTILDEMDSPVMPFPAITICNYNKFRKSQIRRNDIFWMAGMLGVEQGDFDDFIAALGQPTDNSKFFPSKTFNMLEFVQRTSHNIDEMLLDCKYRGKECGPENFTTVSMGQYPSVSSDGISVNSRKLVYSGNLQWTAICCGVLYWNNSMTLPNNAMYLNVVLKMGRHRVMSHIELK